MAEKPFQGGKAPPERFDRMVMLSREIVRAIAEEYGSAELLRRLSDPYWFQAFGCVIGFDWHSSGVTTTTLGALKDGLKKINRELDIFIAGGKGGVSRKTPDQIRNRCEFIGIDPSPLIYASRMSVKVDSTVLQDGYQIYAHSIIFTSKGEWTVVQQGMNRSLRYARRYHWLGSNVKSFVSEPHSGIIADVKENTLDLTSAESERARDRAVKIVNQPTREVMSDLREVVRLVKELDSSGQGDLFDTAIPAIASGEQRSFTMPRRHWVAFRDIRPDRLSSVLLSTYEKRPRDFESMVGLEGVGAKTLRALALMSEVIYGAAPSFKDPARFSYAAGGKNGAPYHVDTNESVSLLKRAIDKARIGESERKESIKRLSAYFNI